MVKSLSLLSLLMFIIALLLFSIQSQQGGGAEAFLLSHRNLLVPFASTKMGNNPLKFDSNNRNNNNKNNNIETFRHPFGNLFMPKAFLLKDDRILGAKNGVKWATNDNLSTGHDATTRPRVHSRRKRLHQLSSLRHIGIRIQRPTMALLEQLIVEHRQPKWHFPTKWTSFDLLWILKRNN